MTKRKENDDEVRAENWLRQQGYNDIQRPASDPPDFVVDGKYAVEVTRLGQRIMVGDDEDSKDEKQEQEPLKRRVENVLGQLGPPGNKGRSWAVYCEYDLTQGLPDPKTVTVQISEALKPLLKPYDDHVISSMRSKHWDYRKYAGETSDLKYLRLFLKCGIHLKLLEFSSDSASFYLQDVSDGKGIFITGELKKSIRNRIRDKSEKIRKQNRIEEYANWWLILVDHIYYMPMKNLSNHELASIGEQDFDFWSRIVIVSAENQGWYYDLLSDETDQESLPFWQ